MITLYGWWDESDDTALQVHDLKIVSDRLSSKCIKSGRFTNSEGSLDGWWALSINILISYVLLALCQSSSCSTFQYIVVAILKLAAIFYWKIVFTFNITINDTFDIHLTYMIKSLSMWTTHIVQFSSNLPSFWNLTPYWLSYSSGMSIILNMFTNTYANMVIPINLMAHGLNR